ncbi:MAG: toll/interleukin-1 receptor domain-containing protein [Hyphomonadaceae bacterium]|nr:toll/interleukin-1 receptor domain-containing protein [Hyphomonadaceae bacterium]
MVDVFISYKREEQARVARLAGALEALKLDVWYDVALSAGGVWAQEIDQHARAAKAMIVCWSPGAAESQWVMHEARIGNERRVLLPVTIVESAPPPEYEHVHAPDLTTWSGEWAHPGLMSLLGSLEGLTGRSDLRKIAEMRGGGERPQTVAHVRRLLVARARRRKRPVSYEAVLKVIQTKDNALQQQALWGVLDAIADQNRALREPPLFALVVNHASRRPGRGYFQKHAFLDSLDTDLGDKLHTEHLRQVYAHEWPRDG